jgi:NitT/TauT family transport system permease protein
MKRTDSKWLTWLPPVLTAGVVLGLWQGIISVFQVPDYLLPTPRQVAGALWRDHEFLFNAALHTGGSALVGFFAAVIGGALVAVALANSRWMKAALYPWVLLVQMVPVVVMVPIFVLWFGAGFPSVVAISFVISFFPVVASTTLGLVSTDRALLELFAIQQATKLQEIFLLRVPSALPYFLTGVKIAATLAPIGAISGEFLAGTEPNTLGYILIYDRAIPGKMPEVFAVALVTCALGFLFVGAVRWLSWLLLRQWHDSAQNGE